MIYELSLVTKAELTPEQIEAMNQIVREVVKSGEGEILIEDDWGKRQFAQPVAGGTTHGHFLYFMFRANNEANKELTRRFGINEGVITNMIVKMSERDEEAAKLAKAYKTPFSKKYNGSVTDEDEEEEGMAEAMEGEGMDKDRRRFSRRKNCWFSAKNITADWKDPKTFGWLINEFGKISPARISGISRKHQRFAEKAIKRARNLGISSHLSNRMLS
jgi:small subunit ribosomal protein S6